MNSLVILLALTTIGAVSAFWPGGSHGGDSGGHGFDHDGHFGGRPVKPNSQYCTIFWNQKVNLKTYPDCADSVDCNGCRSSWWGRCRVDRCCSNVVLVPTIVSKNYTDCCTGYTGFFCNEPKCFELNEDLTQTCVAPGVWGPACYPACKEGSTCIAGTPENTCTDNSVCLPSCQNGGVCVSGECSCPEGFSGSSCETAPAAVCAPACLNGGICESGVCACAAGFEGDSCETLSTLP